MKRLLSSAVTGSLLAPGAVLASKSTAVRDTVGAGGISAIWILANLSYARIG